jgi:hypothetical protein
MHGLYTNIFGLIALGIYILAIRDKRNNYFKGIITCRQGFVTGIVLIQNQEIIPKRKDHKIVHS